MNQRTEALRNTAALPGLTTRSLAPSKTRSHSQEGDWRILQRVTKTVWGLTSQEITALTGWGGDERAGEVNSCHGWFSLCAWISTQENAWITAKAQKNPPFSLPISHLHKGLGFQAQPQGKNWSIELGCWESLLKRLDHFSPTRPSDRELNSSRGHSGPY